MKREVQGVSILDFENINLHTAEKANVTVIVLYSFTLHILAKIFQALQKYGIINQSSQ